ncbi:hypothetical protein HCN44_006547 [Aphidius gifuensis]|uniref:CBM21 domain-containing protein n=1 Tax=Aphidius gifuensis TaxID=684658 RepID=A0A834Y0G1_APHGI|nr:glycogen-binding subunit 76A isoform X2 [Aphidius gifuensis]KAF7995440.1 hypothetical protein HCN44_006547 [Aphidius gifuensis]
MVDDKDKLPRETRSRNKMSSTEQPGGNETNGASTSSCGIVTSLFPSSCRGRAEAFARRLHRRLTNLGDIEGPTIPGDSKLSEKTWLQKNQISLKTNNLRALQSQPKNTIYTNEITTKTTNDKHENSIVKINNKQSNDDSPQSDNNYSTPFDATTPDENNTDVYYDIELSDNDKTHTDDYYDPVLSSESEFTSVNGHHDNNEDDTDESIDNKIQNESSDTSESLTNGFNNKLPCCSDESSNDIKSSTSQSHDSLWSTFDDNTVSLQDDNVLPNDELNNNKLAKETILPKSYSDSVLLPGSSGVFHGEIANPIEDKNNFKHQNGDLLIDNPLRVDETIIKENKKHTDERLRAESEPCLHVDDVTRLLRRLSCSPSGSFDDKNGDDDDDGGSGGSADDHDDVDEEEEEEEEEDKRPMKLRRCSSLKTGKTPPGTPGTPGRKKIVRFADVLGLDLADVRTFLDEIPKIPNSAYDDLVYDDFFQKDSSPIVYGSSPVNNTNNIMKLNCNNTINNKILMPLFQNPNLRKNFIDIVRDNQVCLENIIINDPITFCIVGNVRVRNLDFHKSVYIRYTLDCWKSYSDLQALHVDGSCDGFSDKFTFKLYCHTLKVEQRLELAVRFQCQGVQYWDNNFGVNYCFQCLSSTQSSNYVPSVNRGNTTRDYSPAFY